jgi:hypothetical protein
VKIFISYSREDAGDLAGQIRKYLTRFKYEVFTDDSIRAGDFWDTTIETQISSCDVFVVILTYGALESPYVEREVLHAQREKKRIIPCVHRRLIHSQLKWSLDKIQGVEFDDKFELARNLYYEILQLTITTLSINGDIASHIDIKSKQVDLFADWQEAVRTFTSETNNHGRGTVKHEIKPPPMVQTSIKFGRIIVRNTKTRMHGGTYDDGDYYVEVINEVPNTVAISCKGFLDMPNEEIRRHTTVWEDASEIINIGHNALLFLFTISVFNEMSEGTSTRLYFYRQERIVDRRAEELYNKKLDKRLKVLIQSENALFPSESETLHKTIREIKDEAVQE